MSAKSGGDDYQRSHSVGARLSFRGLPGFIRDGIRWQSRRASQDGSRNIKDNFQRIRSKSRSVDHGISPSIDLDLKSKVDMPLHKFGKDEDNLENNNSEKKKQSEVPINTINYTVADRDTLTSVAARFDTTPSELSKLNRLGSTFIFPGQQLIVPQRDTNENKSESLTPPIEDDDQDDLPLKEKELLDNLRPVSPKPGHVERVHVSTSSSLSETPLSSTISDKSIIIQQRFLKINVRHITDGQGVVSGVLLVTPNAVMFDPNVSDALVIEHGPEAYGVIAPMEFVVNVAIYNDIAHMRVGNNIDNTWIDKKPEIYYPPELKSEQESLSVKDETLSELAGVDDNESVCSYTEREGDAFPKAFERDLVTPTNLDQQQQQQSQSQSQEQSQSQQQTDVSKQESSLEERRKSLIDHHWAIPIKEKSLTSEDSGPKTFLEEDESLRENNLSKENYHDSGIDIREARPAVPIPAKKYSDAEIVLSKEWVPPVTISPTIITSENDNHLRKKNNSVPFGFRSNSDDDFDSFLGPINSSHNSSTNSDRKSSNTDKADGKKVKMLKRLSYPLSWMETLGGEKEEEKIPTTDIHHSSVFSKVFSSSPLTFGDFGTSLFAKTPSEENEHPLSAGSIEPNSSQFSSSSESSSSFFPTNIISSVGASVGAVGAQVGAMGAQVGASVGAMGAQVSATMGSVGRSSVGTFIKQASDNSNKHNKIQTPKLDYRSMVSFDDMPELFVSFDKLIPRPARSCEDPPLYLRLRMGKPLNKSIPRSTPLISYGKKKMRPEYWFSIPKNKVDELYKFIHYWVPHLYGELDKEKIQEKGFLLIETDTELWNEDNTPSASRHGSQDGDINQITKESWELIKAPYSKIYNIIKSQTMSAEGYDEILPDSDQYRKAFYSSIDSSLDVELSPPDLIGTTEILTNYHREALCRHLPARAEGYPWTLVFSTIQHGFSLNSMYRKMNKLESPILLAIEDTDNNVFGALTSCALQVSEHFYGTGESLLFRFSPEFQVYNWTGENLYFIKGNNESLSIGAGDGKFGLWLDGDLYLGRSETCKTYGNEPLTPKVDFVVKTLECWAFISN